MTTDCEDDEPRNLTRDMLIDLLYARCDEAKTLHPSPDWAACHAAINDLLDTIVGR